MNGERWFVQKKSPQNRHFGSQRLSLRFTVFWWAGERGWAAVCPKATQADTKTTFVHNRKLAKKNLPKTSFPHHIGAKERSFSSCSDLRHMSVWPWSTRPTPTPRVGPIWGRHLALKKSAISNRCRANTEGPASTFN